MRALDRVHDHLSKSMGFMHQARWRALWNAVEAVLRGRRLWLTALGRARRSSTTPKHSIKAIDRLLGSHLLQAERRRVYAALVTSLVRRPFQPIILVDEVEFQDTKGTAALVASIAYNGRSLPIYALVGKRKRIENQRVLRRFLRELSEVLPQGCRPVLVTDAAYERPWFEALESMGWDYVGRVRGATKFLVKGHWRRCSDLHARATHRAQNLGHLPFPRVAPRARRVVLSKQPTSQHRYPRTSKGARRHSTVDVKERAKAHEPWILVTTLTARPSHIVALYALRMQIEETFRDHKSHRWGWSLRHTLSRSYKRLELLLLIGALAYTAQVLIGVAAEHRNLHYGYQANTVRTRRVLSVFLLGSYLLEHDDPSLTCSDVRRAFAHLRKQIASHSSGAS